MTEAAEQAAAEIVLDVMSARTAEFVRSDRTDIAALMVEYKALFEHLLREATLRSFVRGCAHAEEALALHEAPAGAAH